MAKNYAYRVVHKTLSNYTEESYALLEQELNNMGQGWRLVQLYFRPPGGLGALEHPGHYWAVIEREEDA